MKKPVIFLLLIITVFSIAKAQDASCKVLMQEIQGTYSGECKNGKANGMGKSIGTDQYDGNFKNGYPDGEGTYTWKDGHYFTGIFKKGEMNGKGTMIYKLQNNTDSTITGYWKKNKYIGLYAEKYVVVSQTTHVTKVECYQSNEKGNTLTITLHRLGGTSSNNSVPSINSISPSLGTYYDHNSQVLSNVSITRVRQVVFPFKAIFYMNNGDNVEILFNTKGDYEVSVDLLY